MPGSGDLVSMSAATASRRVLMACAAACFGTVYTVFYFFERDPRPGRFLLRADRPRGSGRRRLDRGGRRPRGHEPVCGRRRPLPTDRVLQRADAADGVRAVTFVAMGLLIDGSPPRPGGCTCELAMLAERYRLTGLPNTRAFEKAIGRDLSAGGASRSCSRTWTSSAVPSAPSEPPRVVGDMLAAAAGVDDEIARISGGQFAVLGAPESLVGGEHFERALLAGLHGEVRLAQLSEDGENAVPHRAADERLYARRSSAATQVRSWSTATACRQRSRAHRARDLLAATSKRPAPWTGSRRSR